MRAFILASFLGGILAASAYSEPAEKEKAPPVKEALKDVDKLIEQLGDSEFDVRDKAAKKLLEIGADALPALRKALQNTDADPEIRRRLTEMVPQIETSAALSPKIVSLSAENQTLKQIFDDLSKQTGYRFEHFGGNPNQAFSFQFEKKPLWQVVDAICEASGLAIMQTYQEDVIRLQTQDAHVPYISHDGSFRTVATGFQLVKNNNFGQVPKSNPIPQRSDSLTLNLMVYVEPKIPMLSIGQGTITTAYDEHKTSMNPEDLNNPNNPFTSRSAYRNGGYKMYSSAASLNLLMPGDGTRKLKYIKGNIPVTLIASQKQELLTSEVLKAKGKQFTSGAMNISVEDVTEVPGGQLSIKMSITNADSKKDPNDYSWQNSIYQRMEVQDEEGHKFNHAGSSWGGSGPGQMTITLNFAPPGGGAKPGAPTKFLFQAWTLMQTAVTFEFKDLPLP